MRIRVTSTVLKEKYPECESVALVIQDARRICRILLS